jgi:hypothetical protein
MRRKIMTINQLDQLQSSYKSARIEYIDARQKMANAAKLRNIAIRTACETVIKIMQKDLDFAILICKQKHANFVALKNKLSHV